jgi:hypothetical protein
MPSSRAIALSCAVLALSATAEAQTPAPGFAVDRFYPSAPGGGWFVMDALDMRGALGGAVELQGAYARNPLRVPEGAGSLDVVSDQAVADIGVAVTYDRWRLYLNFDAPLVTKGQSGAVAGYQYTAPSVSFAASPDVMGDLRIGVDGRFLGGPKSPFRLGASAQIYVSPGDHPSDYDTDGTVRAMLRVLAAGDLGLFTYAGQVGVHIRPLDDTPVPGSPEGSELLFGFAAGARFHVAPSRDLIFGPELFGETAFRSFFGNSTTGFEALLTTRVEGTANDGASLRFKLGAGGGIDPQFGAPEWRVVFGIEVFNHRSDRDGDGVTDGNDACPDTPGITTRDPKTNGCPSVPGTEGVLHPLDPP